jgi:hypothetical protein
MAPVSSAEAKVVRVGYYPGYGYYGGYGGWRHRHYGGAVAAGIVGGLALGALAASAAQPTYVSGCWTERRSFVNAWGDVTIRRVRVCN